MVSELWSELLRLNSNVCLPVCASPWVHISVYLHVSYVAINAYQVLGSGCGKGLAFQIRQVLPDKEL